MFDGSDWTGVFPKSKAMTTPRQINSNILDVKPLPTTTDPNNRNDDDVDGPSWGLIIPIIMICVFLVGVGLCLWWNKWRDKRTLHLHRDHPSFQRSYRGSRSARNNLDAIRDSTRSTLPLRNSMNEKINIKNTNNIANMSKISRVNVIPLNRPNKFNYHWDGNHIRGYPQHRNPVGRPGTKPLSPIDEIDSPSSVKLSELSRNFEIGNQPSFSPYHIAWVTSSNSHLESMYTDPISKHTSQFRRSLEEYLPSKMNNLDQNQNSPFFPNNNTPTTECETESEESIHGRRTIQSGSVFTSYPSSPNSHTVHSLSHSTGDRNMTSYGTSFPESSFQTSSQQSADKNSSYLQSCQTSITEPSSKYFSSLPSSIAHFSQQNVLHDDPNNNSIVVPNAYLTYPLTKIVSYTNHSSLESSETQISDNTSMLPNVGSGNTSTYPSNTNFRSQPTSNDPSGHVSPEDLSKLVDEMSSIRPVDESSMRPNSTFDPTPQIVSVTENSVTAGTQESWVHHAEQESINTTATSSQPTSQNGSLYWDNYPLHEKQTMSRSFPDLPLHVHDNPGYVHYTNSPFHNYQVPTLMEKQYWV